MKISNIGIVGCGVMGSGIAHTCARCGYQTTVLELDRELLQKGIDRIFKFIDKGIEKGKTTIKERETVECNLKGTTDTGELSGCDLIIEAIPENFSLKVSTFQALNKIAPPSVIFASNTSSLKISDLARNSGRIARFVGTHFFNPVPIMKLCEVVRIEETSDEVFSAVIDFIQSLDKVVVRCEDTTGFVVNRLLTPYLLDAVRAFEYGIASIRDLDNAMKLGLGYPMGPLALIDMVGVETVHHIAGIMAAEYKLPQYKVPFLLEEMIHKGWLGRKSGVGFYNYSQDEPVANDLALKALLEKK
jgi:3-hydroxybutyryl-CoA dehydrogenase